MSEKEILAMKELDEAAEKAGGFLAPVLGSKVQYDYRKLLRYCKERAIEPVDLTIRELGQFVIAK